MTARNSPAIIELKQMYDAIDQAVAQVRNRTEISRWRGLNRLLQIGEELESYTWIALDRCLRLSEEGYAPDPDFLPHNPRLINIWSRLRQQLESTSQAHWYEEDYLHLRNTACLALDLLGRLPSPEALREIRAALPLADPQLRMWAIAGLIRHSEPIEAADLESVAVHPAVRYKLETILRTLNKEYLLPAQYTTPSARAAAQMAHWLAFPTELGVPPTDLEEMDRLLLDGFAEPFYVFRFRTIEPHWAARSGWMAGIVGSCGPFSCFEQWSLRTPREHCEEILRHLPNSCP